MKVERLSLPAGRAYALILMTENLNIWILLFVVALLSTCLYIHRVLAYKSSNWRHMKIRDPCYGDCCPLISRSDCDIICFREFLLWKALVVHWGKKIIGNKQRGFLGDFLPLRNAENINITYRSLNEKKLTFLFSSCLSNLNLMKIILEFFQSSKIYSHCMCISILS